MFNHQHITLIIPALNEADAIGRVIDDVPNCIDRIIVVDNGSTDDTAKIARAHGADVVTEAKRGYGSACLAGLEAVGKTDLVGFVDSDYSDFPADLSKVIAPVANGMADLSIGCRINGRQSKGGLLWHQYWGNRLACACIRLVHGYRFSDFGPMRCIRWNKLKRLAMEDQDYGWTSEMQIKAARAGLNLVEVPVRYRERLGHSKISGTLKGSVLAGYKIIYWVVRLRFTVTPRVDQGVSV